MRPPESLATMSAKRSIQAVWVSLMVAVLSFITIGAGVCAAADQAPPSSIAAVVSARHAAFVVVLDMKAFLPSQWTGPPHRRANPQRGYCKSLPPRSMDSVAQAPVAGFGWVAAPGPSTSGLPGTAAPHTIAMRPI